MGSSEFAIPAARIEQVVAVPDCCVEVPQSPDFVRGTFDLRGTIVTLIDLEILFGIPKSNQDGVDQVAVLEYEDQCLGVIFECTGEVFRGNLNEFSEFHEDTRNPFVSGVFKRFQGKRLVQAFDIEGLFANTRVPRDKSSLDASNRFRNTDRGGKTQFMTFSVGDTCCALPISEIQEVFAIESIEQSVFTGRACLGLTELRGGTLPIIDLMVLLGCRATRQGLISRESQRVIVIQCGSDLVGFLVTSINDIMSAYQDEIVPVPAYLREQTVVFGGCIVKSMSPDVMVFDHVALRAIEEVEETTRVHGKLATSPLKPLANSNEKSNSSSRETFLIFSAGQRYAVRMNEIQEIIDLPDELLQPPGLPDCFSGIVNLRGQSIVAIVDLRQSHQSSIETQCDGKVIIFDSDGGKAGLIVDSVDSIYSVNTNEIFNLPTLETGVADEFQPTINMKCPTGNDISASVIQMQDILQESLNASGHTVCV